MTDGNVVTLFAQERYDNLDLDLECDGGGGGGVADGLSSNSDLSKSNDSLTDGSAKDTLSLQNPELSVSSDSLTDKKSSKEKSGVFGGILKRSPKPGHARRPSQDDLSADGEPSAGSESITEKSTKSDVASKILKNPFTSSSQDKERTEHSGDSNENTSTTEKPKAKQNGFSAMMKSTFYTDKQEKNSDSDCEEMLDNEEGQSGHKQQEKQTGSDDEDPPASGEKSSSNKQKDTEDTETLKEDEKQVEEKPKAEMKSTSTHAKVKARGTEDTQDTKDMISREKKAKPAKTPARASEENQSDDEEGDESNPPESKTTPSDDEGLKEEDEEKKEEEGKDKTEETKVKKPKRHNPFMPRVKASSDDEGLKEEDDSSSKEEKKDEEGKDKTETKVKKPKKHNPFMPRVKGRTPKPAQDGSAENEGGNRSLFDQLEDLRVEPSRPENRQDVEDLMEWWNTVESWEDTPQDDDMTEKEEAKAFAVTAEKVQKGIRVFNKLFSERAESLWQHVIDLNGIADGLDKAPEKMPSQKTKPTSNRVIRQSCLECFGGAKRRKRRRSL
ncbi:hypothetical protein D9C73_014288 [Collichthys lucidus]|uniref:Uncharacterized protein n=1 Tax=Collichthys lucidus TaxID=240159 RepID=A0A4V6AQ82_COLLU|nr:hypothetical protein D9C73_014288 [Collichthys lucidus]